MSLPFHRDGVKTCDKVYCYERHVLLCAFCPGCVLHLYKQCLWYFVSIVEIRSLDSEMQTLVYENYNKFISATDTIRKVK